MGKSAWRDKQTSMPGEDGDYGGEEGSGAAGEDRGGGRTAAGLACNKKRKEHRQRNTCM